jgi:hypothetical protein
MKEKSILWIMAAILLASSPLKAQNVAVGTSSATNKLTVNGNLSIGSGYIGTAAPADGAIISGNVGIGNSSPGVYKLSVTGNTNITGNATITGTLSAGGNTYPVTAGTSGQVLSTNGAGTISWTTPSAGGVTSVTGTSPISSTGGATPAISIALANTTTNGYISSTDWNTFNNKIGGSGTTNYVPKWSSSSALGNSLIYDNGTNIGIGTASPNAQLTVGAAMGGTALSPTFITNTGTLSSTSGTKINLANFGFASGNNSSLGIHALRTATGSDWTTTAVGLLMDVDNTSPVNNAQIWLNSSGNTGIGTSAPTQVLDVAGNVKFSGALMPNNTAGTSGQVLTSAGAGTAPTWTTPASNVLVGMQVFSSGSGTYTPTAGTKSIFVKMVGGGGAGGAANYSGCSGSYFVGGGGGAGGYCESVINAVAASYSYSVGAGGAANTNCAGVAGGNGGNTTFGTFAANGGTGSVSLNTAGYVAGGAGGTASGATLNMSGASGGYGTLNTATGTALSGVGGASTFGSGGDPTFGFGTSVIGGTGAAGKVFGAGGSGAVNLAYSATYAGGAGKGGVIIIYEYK